MFQRITLQVQDSAGIYHTVFRDIFPNKTDATVTTSPPGLTVKVDAINRVGPVTFQSVVGMERPLVAPDQQTLNGRLYQFQNWSNGGAATQTWIVPDGNPTITANYQDIGPAWTGQNVGAASPSGSFSFGSTISVQASGADIYGAADAGYLVYRNITGDATITARLASLGATNVWAKAGVMIRESTAAGARNVATFLSPTATNKYRKQIRMAAGGSTTSTPSTPNSAIPALGAGVPHRQQLQFVLLDRRLAVDPDRNADHTVDGQHAGGRSDGHQSRQRHVDHRQLRQRDHHHPGAAHAPRAAHRSGVHAGQQPVRLHLERARSAAAPPATT